MPKEENTSNTNNPKGRIEKMRDNLYSRDFEEQDVIGDIPEKDYNVSADWSNAESAQAPSLISRLPMKKILIGSAVFFGISLVIALLFAFRNPFSADNVELAISGPVSVAGGKETMLTVRITNNNDQPIESADLFIRYPEGAYASLNAVDELSRVKYELENIAPKQTVNEQIPAILFGAENSEKEIEFSLEFRFKGSSATLEKSETYVVTITSSPIDLALDILKEATANQELEIIANIKSNSEDVLEDVLLTIEYPFGFTFLDATPAPLYGSDTWEIGDITPGAERKITITGIVEGQHDEEKVFRAQIGKRNESTGEAISTIYNSITEPVVVKRPFLALDIVLAGDRSPEYIGKEEKEISGEIIWKSNISTKILNAKIVVELSGGSIDKRSVRTNDGGFYQSFDNTILWDSSNTRAFEVVEPGETGRLGFRIKSLPLEGFINPEINITVSAEGQRISDTNVPEQIKSSASRLIKLESDLSMTPRAVYYVGPFTNTGPLPPRVEQETTYTIIWTATNSSNKIRSTQMRTTLPPNVQWLNTTAPSGEDITYNNTGREVVWNLGDVEAGAGVTLPLREVSFQVSLLPSVSQRSTLAPLTSQITLSGEDTFTGTTLTETKQALNTKLSTDPYASGSYFTVQE